MRFLFLMIVLLNVGLAQAQYLKTHNNTSLRVDSKSGSATVIGGELDEGAVLELLDNGQQTNGYYHARIPETQIEGWIYRSQVKKVSEALPSFFENASGVEVYVVDVGAGLGCIIKTPENKYIIYDGGKSKYVYKFLKNLYPVGGEIPLVIVSHTDSDHWEAIDEIAEGYQIKRALYTSYRPDGFPESVSRGMNALIAEPDIEIQDIAMEPIPLGTTVYEELEQDFSLTFLSGFGQRDDAFASQLGSNASKLRNAASIVIKLTYQDQSVLFTGDIVGLKECKKVDCSCEYDCISTEKLLLDSMRNYLESNVIIAPHHGARNASCPEFIKAVNAEYVVFSSGNNHKHPHDLTAQNYQNYGGIPSENIYRTDIGKVPLDNDDDSCNNEWIGINQGETEKDDSFDDHVWIQITEEGELLIDYFK